MTNWFTCTACSSSIREMQSDLVLYHEPGALYFFHASGDCELAAIEVARSSRGWTVTHRDAVGDEERLPGADVVSLRGIEPRLETI